MANQRQPNPNRLGGIYKQTSKEGKKYFSGKLFAGDYVSEDINIVIFANDYKVREDGTIDEKQPDFIVFKSEPPSQQGSKPQRPQQPKQQWNPRAQRGPAQNQRQNVPRRPPAPQPEQPEEVDENEANPSDPW